MTTLTKRVTLSSNDWDYLELYAKAYNWKSVLEGLDNAELLAETSSSKLRDTWAADAASVGVTPDVHIPSIASSIAARQLMEKE